jgi:hypothetical protein
MSDIAAKPGTGPREVKVHKVRGVQVYGRKDPDGSFSNLDAIDEDEEKIREIADQLQRCGYGVMRQRQARAGRTYYVCKATWIGPGPCPEDPFDQDRAPKENS